MTNGKSNAKYRSEAESSLRAQAYEQELKLLEMANKSPNPEIQAYALKAAAQERKHIQRQEARLSTPAAVICCCLTWSVGLGLSWYALVQYAAPLCWEIASAVTVACIILTLLFLTFARLVDAKVVVEFLRHLWKRVLRSPNHGPDDREES